MAHGKKPSGESPSPAHEAFLAPSPIPHRPGRHWAFTGLAPALASAGVGATTLLSHALSGSALFASGAGIVLAGGVGYWAARRSEQRRAALGRILDATERMAPLEPDARAPEELGAFMEAWRAQWDECLECAEASRSLLERVRGLPETVNATIAEIVAAAGNQEEAVEETASLVANMKTSMRSISDAVERLLSSSDESASSVLELSSSIDEVARNAESLHETVEASTASVHEMGASIRQVATATESVQAMAESTAASVVQMDRSVQEVSSHAREAASLTERAHAGAEAGGEAVHATIVDIERISERTSEAMARLDGLVARISQIGDILAAIDEINDETNLLSLNAAIIAARAGEQGKAFLVVANHVKTLARRTAGSTQDIEKLIADIERESQGAVHAMEAGIEAVETGVDRSRTAGGALASIQEACRDASERVAEIARATEEQTRNSKGVSEATQRTSSEIRQISAAMVEQSRASESMLSHAEHALDSCRNVRKSTAEQRETSRYINQSIATISEMIHGIGQHTGVHATASESVSEAVQRLLENALRSGGSVAPIREALLDLQREAAAMGETVHGESWASPGPSDP